MPRGSAPPPEPRDLSSGIDRASVASRPSTERRTKVVSARPSLLLGSVASDAFDRVQAAISGCLCVLDVQRYSRLYTRFTIEIARETAAKFCDVLRDAGAPL